MKTSATLLRDYKDGRSTASEVILEVLYLPDTGALEKALATTAERQ